MPLRSARPSAGEGKAFYFSRTLDSKGMPGFLRVRVFLKLRGKIPWEEAKDVVAFYPLPGERAEGFLRHASL